MRLLPILLMILLAIGIWQVSAWSSGRSLRRNSKPLHNDQIEVLLRRLASTAGVEKVGVRMLDDASVNGLATPSGEIYVTRGLVRQLQNGKISAPEFASVIAHEMGHLALGHTRRRMIDVAAAQAVNLIVGGLLARLVPFVGWYLARLVSNLMVAGLSRKDEFEADAYATALMLRSGLGAEPQARMLEKLIELVPGAGDAARASWLASHPPVAERAQRIRTNAGRWREEEA